MEANLRRIKTLKKNYPLQWHSIFWGPFCQVARSTTYQHFIIMIIINNNNNNIGIFSRTAGPIMHYLGLNTTRNVILYHLSSVRYSSFVSLPCLCQSVLTHRSHKYHFDTRSKSSYFTFLVVYDTGLNHAFHSYRLLYSGNPHKIQCHVCVIEQKCRRCPK